MDGSHSQAAAIEQDSLPWTSERVAELKRLNEEGWPTLQIAVEMRKTHNAVKCKLRRILSPRTNLNPVGRPLGWPQERVDRLLALRKDGVSFKGIAARIGNGITKNAVIGKLHRLGNPYPVMPGRPKTTHDEDREAGKRGRPPNGPKRLHTAKLPVVVSLPTRAAEGRLAPLCASFSPIVARPLGTSATLIERHPQGCCRPINDGSPYLYCNSHRLAGVDYCPECFSIMFTAPPPRALTSHWIKWR